MPQVLETKAYTTGQGIAITLIVLDGLLVFALLAFYVVLALLQNKVNRRLTPLWLVTCALWAWAL
jgi:hypothetical protein